MIKSQQPPTPAGRGSRHATWRVSQLTAIGFLAVAAAVMLIVFIPEPGVDVANDPWTTWGGFVLGLCFLAVPIRVKLSVRGDRVIVRGILLRRSFLIQQLVDVQATYSGLALRLEDGRIVTATLVGEKTNFAAMIGRRGRSDDLAETLLDWARRAREQPP